MSYILEALRKAEQQREIGHVPGIGSDHERIRASAGGRWVWVLVAVLVVNAVLLAYVFWPAADPEPVVLVERNETVPQARQSPVVPVQPELTVAVAPPPVQPAPTGRTAGQETPAVPLRPLKPLPQAAPANVGRPQTPASGMAIENVASPPKLQQSPSAKTNNNLPVWPQVSAQLFQQIRGGLRLDVHVYSEQPRERFVLINMQKYNQGQQLQEGPSVDEITTEGVILSYQGQRFRLRSQ